MVGALHRIAQAIGVNRPYLLAFLVALTSCATTSPHEFAEARADWQTRSGQLLYRNPKATVIGDVFVRFSRNGDFELTFSNGPGVNLLFLRQDSTSAESRDPSLAVAGRVRSTARPSNCADGSDCATRSFTPSPRRVRPLADGIDIRCIMFRVRKLFFSDSDPCRSLTNTGLQTGVTP